jgi:hypothetical protein
MTSHLNVTPKPPTRLKGEACAPPYSLYPVLVDENHGRLRPTPAYYNLTRAAFLHYADRSSLLYTLDKSRYENSTTAVRKSRQG